MGTARHPGDLPELEPGFNALTDSLSAHSPERRLLLAAGAWSVYRMAGAVPTVATAPPEPCEPDARATCSLTGRALLQQMLDGKHPELLPVVFARMHTASHKLPPGLLPQALDLIKPPLRAALAPLLGPRARWLAQFNPDWQWVLQPAPGSIKTGLPADVQQRFEQGSHLQRMALLRLVRAVAPTRALDWLAGTWLKERAAERTAMLELLGIGLSMADEPFLEQVRVSDRAVGVKRMAAQLLAKLPGSRLVGRMKQRADELVNIAVDSTGKITVTITYPDSFDTAWTEDGLASNPRRGIGRGVYAVMQVVGRVPPSHWIRPDVQPVALLDALEDGSGFANGLSRAVVRFSDFERAGPVWDYWTAAERTTTPSDRQLAIEVAGVMPDLVAEFRAIKALRERDAHFIAPLLKRLDTPWPEPLAQLWITTARQITESMSNATAQNNIWIDTFATAALALPESLLDSALEPWTLPEDAAPWSKHRWEAAMDRFTFTLRFRKRLATEFPS